MARDLNIFVREPCRMEPLLEHLSEVLGHSFVQDTDAEWPLYRTTAMGFNISVYDQEDFEDEKGIPLSQYALIVDFDRVRDAVDDTIYEEWRLLFARFLASGISKQFQCESIVVDNLQHLVATYGPQAPPPY